MADKSRLVDDATDSRRQPTVATTRLAEDRKRDEQQYTDNSAGDAEDH